MSKTKAIAKSNEKKKVNDSLTKIVENMNEEGMQTLFDVFSREAQEFQLDMERKRFLKEELHLNL